MFAISGMFRSLTYEKHSHLSKKRQKNCQIIQITHKYGKNLHSVQRCGNANGFKLGHKHRKGTTLSYVFCGIWLGKQGSEPKWEHL